jgi:hypothetical protein
MIKSIKQGTYIKQPFPVLIMKDFLPNDICKNLNKEWPKKELFQNKDIYIQNKKNTKQIIITNTDTWKKVMKESYTIKRLFDFFNNLNTFKIICNIFKNDIKEHLNINIDNIIPNVKFDISECNSNYNCNIHADRRDHIFSMLIYPDMIDNNNSQLNIYELKDKNALIYDVFPKVEDVNLVQSIKSSHNNALIMFNTPFAYHSVNSYNSKNKNHKRRYIYVSYDYIMDNNNITIKSNGCNNINIWKRESKVFSTIRKNKFLGID